MASLTRKHVERNWIPSVGDGEGDHFREPPPGRRHAVCKSGTKRCRVHEDQHNPHAGLFDAISHFFEWRGAPLVIGGAVLGALLLNAADKSQAQAWCPTCGAGIRLSLMHGFSYRCQSCMNWFYVP